MCFDIEKVIDIVILNVFFVIERIRCFMGIYSYIVLNILNVFGNINYSLKCYFLRKVYKYNILNLIDI